MLPWGEKLKRGCCSAEYKPYAEDYNGSNMTGWVLIFIAKPEDQFGSAGY